MEPRSRRLGRVKRLVDSEEREQCRTMGKAQQALDQHVKRLDELQAYRRDYAGRQPHGGSVSGAQWADYQNFLRRLDDAVAAQAQVVTDGRVSRDLHRQRWMAKRQKVESLQRVVDRYQDAEARHRDRLLQKTQDDLPPGVDPFRHR